MDLMKNKKGITLIELLIAMAIFVAIGFIASMFLIQGVSIFNQESEKSTELASVREVLSHITNHLRLTPEEQVLVNDDVLTVNGIDYELDGNILKYGGNALTQEIADFKVTRNPEGEDDDDIIHISITSTQGKTLETSYKLR